MEITRLWQTDKSPGRSAFAKTQTAVNGTLVLKFEIVGITSFIWSMERLILNVISDTAALARVSEEDIYSVSILPL